MRFGDRLSIALAVDGTQRRQVKQGRAISRRTILVLILVTLVPVATVSALMLRATEEAFRF